MLHFVWLFDNPFDYSLLITCIKRADKKLVTSRCNQFKSFLWLLKPVKNDAKNDTKSFKAIQNRLKLIF